MLRRVRSSLSFKLKDKLPIRRTRSHVYAVKDSEPGGLPEPATRVEKIERLSVTQELGLQNGPEMEYCGPPSHLERIDEGVTARPKGIGYTVYLASNKPQPARVDSDSDFWSGKSSSESKESVSTVSQASDNEGKDAAPENKQTKDETDASTTNVVRRRKPRRKDDKGLSHLSKEERESILLLEEVLTDFGGWESVRSKAPPPESDSDVDTDEETSAILADVESSRPSGPPSRRSTPSSRRRDDGSPAGARGGDRLRTSRAERDKKITSMVDDNWVLRKPETDTNDFTIVSSVIPRQPRKDSPPKAERPSSMYQFGRQPMYFPEDGNDDVDVARKPSWVKQNQAWYARNGHASNGVDAERPSSVKKSPHAQKESKEQQRPDRNGPKEESDVTNSAMTSSGQSEKITVEYNNSGVTSRPKHEEVQRLSMKVMTSHHKVASRASSRGMTSEDEYSTDSLSDLTPDTDSSHGSWRRGGPDSLVSSPRTPDSSVPNSPANTYVANPNDSDNARPDSDASRMYPTNSDVLESPMKPSMIRKMSTEHQLAAFARPTVSNIDSRPAPKPLKGLPSKSKSQTSVKPRALEPPKKTRAPDPPKKVRAPEPPRINQPQANMSSGNGEATLDFGKQKSVTSCEDSATSRPKQASGTLKPPASPSVVVVRNTSPDVTQQHRRPAKEKQPEQSPPKNKTSSGNKNKASNEMRTLKPSQKGAFVTLKHKAPRKRAGGSKRGLPKPHTKTGSDHSKTHDRYHEQSHGRSDRTQHVPVSPERRDQTGSSIVLLSEDPDSRRAGAFVIRPASALYR
ncbi:Hypp7824 [Branchiostoma lanceolatum]|uniref:Hypp7824 protein n=1 Tax=Branchiostoma lanceolatum TaxID=7740 RepID=A0A8J9Z3U8_BRALA|nr:Hypp7824 [Branchiostoma lanceolatum]